MGKKFFDQETVTQPFGAGPWPYLNSASEHLGQKLITSVEISTTRRGRRRVPRGIFRCHCGFAYLRVGPDRSDLGQYHIDEYVSFGDQWDKRVRELMSAGKSPETIAASIDISKRILKSQLVRMGLLPDRAAATKQSKAAKSSP